MKPIEYVVAPVAAAYTLDPRIEQPDTRILDLSEFHGCSVGLLRSVLAMYDEDDVIVFYEIAT